MWSICIGCNILPDLRSVVSKDHALNTCYAVFMAVSTQFDLKRLAPYFTGHIKARLAQWIAESLHEDLRGRMAELSKQAQMLALLQNPLSGISDALAQMQTQTQEIRAVLYDPAKALFDSHRSLSPLFSEHGTLAASDHVLVQLSHRGEYDGRSILDGRVVLAVALCRIFGRDGELHAERTKRGIVSHAKTILMDCETKKAQSFASLVDDLCWLLEVKNDNAIRVPGVDDGSGVLFAPPESGNRGPRLGELLDGPATKPLGILKEVLFQPFKLETTEWSVKALALAVRSYLEEGSPLRGDPLLGTGLLYLKIPHGETPCPFHAVLAFLTDVCAALYEEDSVRVKSVCVEVSESRHSIRVSFSHEWLDLGGLAELSSLIEEYVLSTPRDWRIQATNAGNFRKPFLDLAGRLLGVSRGRRSHWAPYPHATTDGFDVVTVKSVDGRRVFRVRAEPVGSRSKTRSHGVPLIAADLVMEWIPAAQRKSRAR
jgi:hypothetical protein